MNWISVKDKLPEKYDYYLVWAKECNDCIANNDHYHKLNYRYNRYTIALWCEKDMYLVEHKQRQGDHSWDSLVKDYWSCSFTNEEITHWMPLPEKPKE